MPKTKEFTIECSNIRVSPSTGHYIRITIEDPDTEEIFKQFKEKDIRDYVVNNLNPEDVFRPDTLADWADRNGFTKNEKE